MFIKAGNQFSHAIEVIYKYKPMYYHDIQMKFTVYASSAPNLQFTNEKDCRHIGQIILNFSTNSFFNIIMNFGKTTFSVWVKNYTTG